MINKKTCSKHLALISGFIFLLSVFPSYGQFVGTQDLFAKSSVRVQGNLNREFGTGVILAERGARTFVVTAEHVLNEDTNISIFHVSGSYDAIVIARDEERDLALLQIESNMIANEVPYNLVESRDRMVSCDLGESLSVAGYPSGRETPRFVSSRILNLSYLGREFGAEVDGAFISAGMSGGMVFNSNNEFVGLVTSLRSQDNGNVALMIKTNSIKEFAIENGVDPNLLNESTLIGSWKLYQAFLDSGTYRPVIGDHVIEFGSNASSNGLLSKDYCVRNSSQLIINQATPDYSAPRFDVTVSNGAFGNASVSLGDTKDCSLRFAFPVNFTDPDPDNRYGTWMYLSCTPLVVGSVKNLWFQKID